MFLDNESDFINISRRPNTNSRNTPTNNKADKNPGNKSGLDDEFQLDGEVHNSDNTNNTINENFKTTRIGRVMRNLKDFERN
jgi:hypothetical protein